MRTRIFVSLILVCIALPLLADNDQQSKFSATLRFGTGKAEPISSFSWGVSNVTSNNTGGGGGVGKALFKDLTFTKGVTQLSQQLFQGCATGQHFPSVTIDVTDKKGNVFYEIKLTDVLVSSYSVSSGGDLPTETVSLNYGKIEFILIGL
jgi:type VI secretion system secreted protein Hcp